MEQEPDRRRYLRIEFAPPLAGRFGDTDCEVLELNTMGATISHSAPLMLHEKANLRFPYQFNSLQLTGEVRRSEVVARNATTGRGQIHSVLVFDNLSAEDRRALEHLLLVEIENIKAREPEKP
jgi:hypothetical protein